jgi:hypothetical protein
MLNKFQPRRFDDIPDDSWEPKDIGLWATRSIIDHERICAERWGVIMKLMWASLLGIGTILITVVSNYISYFFSILPHH